MYRKIREITTIWTFLKTIFEPCVLTNFLSSTKITKNVWKKIVKSQLNIYKNWTLRFDDFFLESLQPIKSCQVVGFFRFQWDVSKSHILEGKKSNQTTSLFLLNLVYFLFTYVGRWYRKVCTTLYKCCFLWMTGCMFGLLVGAKYIYVATVPKTWEWLFVLSGYTP